MRDIREDVTLCDALLYTAVPFNCSPADDACAAFSDISLEMPGKRQEMPPLPSSNSNIDCTVDTIHTVMQSVAIISL